MSSPNLRMDQGDSYIPASQRPDGTWRKARRVKEGYVPQEEVPLYESKGKQLMSRQFKAADTLPANVTAHRTIPGLFVTHEQEKPKVKKKREKKIEEVSKQLQHVKISETKVNKKVERTETENKISQEVTDPTKKLKNLKKKLREIEALEEKVKAGDLLKFDPDQLKKIDRKPDLLMQIHTLEKIVI